MNRWLYLLLLAVPAAVLTEALHAPPLASFVLAALGIIPLAGLIGLATDVLAARLGHGIGGLLNATFGNAAEIIIGIIALSAGLPDVVRASLAGSIIGNVLLVLGSAALIGGWRHKRLLFNARVAGQYAVMLTVVVIGVAIPSLLATVGENTHSGDQVVRGNALHQLSIGVAIILLLCYAAYIAYSVFNVRAFRREAEPVSRPSAINEEDEVSHARSDAVSQESPAMIQQPVPAAGALKAFVVWWNTTYWLPIVVLAAATAVTAVVSEVLVSTIEPLATQVGLNPFFVGLIILPIVGNAAEHFSAITSAANNRMEISMAITAGSSIQIALLATPLLVLVGLVVGTPLDLNFSLLEVVVFGLVTALYALICLDGEATWLEGFLLCAFYLMLAVGTFFTPS